MKDAPPASSSKAKGKEAAGGKKRFEVKKVPFVYISRLFFPPPSPSLYSFARQFLLRHWSWEGWRMAGQYMA